jgi:WD40 repeat protein
MAEEITFSGGTMLPRTGTGPGTLTLLLGLLGLALAGCAPQGPGPAGTGCLPPAKKQQSRAIEGRFPHEVSHPRVPRGLPSSDLWRGRSSVGKSLTREAPVTTVTLSPRGNLAASVDTQGDLSIWKLDRHPKILQCFHGATPGSPLALGGEGDFVVYWHRQGDLQFQPLKPNRPPRRFPLPADLPSPRHLQVVGTHLLAAVGSHLLLWDLRGRTPGQRYDIPAGPITALSAMAEGTRFVTGHANGVVAVWSLESNRPMLTIQAHQSPVQALWAGGENNHLVSAAHGQPVRIWDRNNGALLREMGKTPKSGTSLGLLSGGRYLVCGGAESPLLVQDLKDAPRQIPLQEPTTQVQALALSQDGRTLVAGTQRGEIWVWDVPDEAK